MSFERIFLNLLGLGFQTSGFSLVAAPAFCLRLSAQCPWVSLLELALVSALGKTLNILDRVLYLMRERAANLFWIVHHRPRIQANSPLAVVIPQDAGPAKLVVVRRLDRNLLQFRIGLEETRVCDDFRQLPLSHEVFWVVSVGFLAYRLHLQREVRDLHPPLAVLAAPPACLAPDFFSACPCLLHSLCVGVLAYPHFLRALRTCD